MSRVSERERRIVFRWMTRHSAEMLGPTLDHAYPIDPPSGFDDALNAIDESERQVWVPGGTADKLD